MNNSENDTKSKSQVKREMTALQKLGEELVRLSAQQLKKLPISEALLVAIQQAQTIKSHEGKRRQLQYIGKLMRSCDPAPIQKMLDIFQNRDQEENAKLHRLEKIRDKLLNDGDEALAEILKLFPQIDRQHLRQLIRKAQQEKEKNQPPTSARALFKYLRELSNEKGKNDEFSE